MPLSGRATDRLASIAIYVWIAIVVLWAGTTLINHSLETKFYKDFLLEWEVALQRYKSEGGRWPEFSGDNQVLYMDRLTQWMANKGMSPPLSNTERDYVYRLKRLGWPHERIFFLCFSHGMLLYGISEKTFRKLDRWIDGEADETKGLFTGRRGKDGIAYVGALQL